MKSPADKLEWITARLAEGRTVYLGTAMRCTVIKPKTWAAWERAGRPLVRVHGGSLQMIERNAYVCADYCNLTAI